MVIIISDNNYMKAVLQRHGASFFEEFSVAS